MTCAVTNPIFDNGDRVANVKAFGAKGDGSTDDTQAIQNAIDYLAAANGGVVLFPPGVYVFSTLTISTDGITLRGSGLSDTVDPPASAKGTVLNTTSQGTALTFSGKFGQLERLTLTTAATPTSAQSMVLVSGGGVKLVDLFFFNYFLAVKATTGLFIERCHLLAKSTGGTSIQLQDAIEARLSDILVTVVADQAAAIDIVSTSGQVDTIDMIGVSVAHSSTSSKALWIHGTNQPRWIQVVNCSLENSPSSSVPTVQIDSGKDIRFSNCYFSGGLNALKIANAGTIGPIRLTNCILFDTNQDVVFHDADVPTELIGCTVADGSLSSVNTYSGVFLGPASRKFQMLGGTCQNGLALRPPPLNRQKYGVFVTAGVTGSSDQFSVRDVRFIGNLTAPTNNLVLPSIPTDALFSLLPRSRAYSGASQPTTSGVPTILTFDTNQYDYGPVHSTAVNPTRFTVPVGGSGVYAFVAQARFDQNAAGVRQFQVLKNGSLPIAFAFISAASLGDTCVPVAGQIDLVAGDYLELQVFQNSGGNLNVLGGNIVNTTFSIAKILDQ